MGWLFLKVDGEPELQEIIKYHRGLDADEYELTIRTMSWLVTKWIREELERWRQKKGRK